MQHLLVQILPEPLAYIQINYVLKPYFKRMLFALLRAKIKAYSADTDKQQAESDKP